MSRRSARRRRGAQGCLSFAIGVLTIVALALVAAILITNRIKPAADGVTDARTGDGNYVDANDLPVSDYQLILNAASFEEAGADQPLGMTPTPGPTAPPTPTPEPTFNPAEPYALVRPQPAGEGYLPVFRKANTDEKRIAITLDECSGATITAAFVRIAQDYNAKLTLFPTGENVLKKGMDEVLKRCLFDLGYEIENRCYTTKARVYQLNDAMMPTEIWKQAVAVNYALGVRYQPHFLRLYGSGGNSDLRTHAYLAQNGYLGIAGWTVSATDTAADQIAATLAPGNVYFFKSTESDAEKLILLLQEARARGYQMVTLNELFGYEANAWEEVSGAALNETMPELQPYNQYYYFMKTGDHTWAVNRLQSRLVQLGYLPAGSADGIFGDSTAAALSAFQANCGLAATGAADVSTQERLFSEDAPPMAG